MGNKTYTIKEIEINEKFAHALDLLEGTTHHIFITGKAGTGKSTLLELFRAQTKKKIVVLAPTGVAALNVKGQTIHSFFGFRPDITPQKVRKINSKDKKAITYKKLEMIVIDEVSMMRSDLLDCIDRFMRLNGKEPKLPFGGVQMVFIGDLLQLPPVVSSDEQEMFAYEYQTPYFFSAKAFENLSMKLVELEQVYRQSDRGFIDLLNSVRNNTITPEQLRLLNSRLMPDFVDNGRDYYIHLTTTNALAEEINQHKLDDIKRRPYIFTGSVTGDFDAKHLPTALELDLKVGAQVMMLNNDTNGRWVNGSIGKIVRFFEAEEDDGGAVTVVEVELPDGRLVEVTPNTWEMYHYFYDIEKGELDSEVVGSFTQYPMKLAWAVTIHKSQGKTFDRVVLDIGNGTFAHGQVYVALSRCTSFEGLILKRPIHKRHILMDWRVVDFVENYNYYNRENMEMTLFSSESGSGQGE